MWVAALKQQPKPGPWLTWMTDQLTKHKTKKEEEQRKAAETMLQRARGEHRKLGAWPWQ